MKPRLLHLIYLIFSAAFNVLHGPTAGGSPVGPIIQSTGTLAAEASDVAVPLESADYPDIRFWYRNNWNKFRDALKNSKASESELEVKPKVSARGKARAAEGINVMMLYIETEDGQSVSGHIASEISATGRQIMSRCHSIRAGRKVSRTKTKTLRSVRAVVAKINVLARTRRQPCKRD